MPVKLLYPILLTLLTLAAPAATLHAQTPGSTGFQLRLAATISSPLAEDEIGGGVLLKQGIAPTLTAAALLPLRPGIDLELSAGYGSSGLKGEDDLGEWDAGSVSVANGLVGIGYRYSRSITLHGGAGITKLFGNDAGVFANANGFAPLLEAGVSFAQSAFALDTRAQMHSFTPASWNGSDGTSGNVFRLAIGVSYTLGRDAQ